MKLTVPKYSQNDARWKTKLLGTSTTSTIGDFGCYLTCLAMVLKFKGYAVTPASLNDKMVANGAFNGDLVNGTVVAQLYKGTFGGMESYDKTPAPITRIKALLDQNTPVICEVDAIPTTSKKETHFVLAVGYTDNSIIINDPWQGGEFLVDVKYPNPNPAYPGPEGAITGLRIYQFPQVEDQDMSEEVNRIVQFLTEQNALSEGKVREAFGALADKPNYETTIGGLNKTIGELNTHQEELEEKVRKLQESIDQLSQVNGDFRKMATEWQSKLDTANITIGNLTTDKSVLEKEKLELAQRLNDCIVSHSKDLTVGRLIELLIQKFLGKSKA